MISRSSAGISRISALVQVVLPEPVGPETRMFLRAATARRMNASYSCALKKPQELLLRSHRAPRSRGAWRERSRAGRAPRSTRPASEGRRIVIATVPGVVAGGSTIWTRSPARERGRQERDSLIDPLPGGVRDQLREPPAPVEVRKRQGSGAPSPAGSR